VSQAPPEDVAKAATGRKGQILPKVLWSFATRESIE
jgi:hypothetical protein